MTGCRTQRRRAIAASVPIPALHPVHLSGGDRMAHLFQVGAGSGGMPVLDMLCRDPRITRVTLIEPDVYKPHNVERHLFPLVGRRRAQGRRWPSAGSRNAGPTWKCACSSATCSTRPLQADDRRGGRRGRPRRLCGRQRAGQVSLGRPDAPPRQAVDARRSAQRRHRRLRPLVRRPAARATAASPATCSAPSSVDKAPPPDYSQPGGAGARKRPSRRAWRRSTPSPRCTPW